MRWMDLMTAISRMSRIEMSQNVTFKVQDNEGICDPEFFAGDLKKSDETTDVLDPGHFFIEVAPEEKAEDKEEYPCWQGRIDYAHVFWQLDDCDFKEILQKFAKEPDVVDAMVLGKLNYQVENGGFSQWHDNGYSKAMKETLAAIKKIGTETATKVYELVDSMNDELEGLEKARRHYDNDRFRSDDDEEPELDGTGLDNLDKKYYELNKQFMLDIEAYFANLK